MLLHIKHKITMQVSPYHLISILGIFNIRLVKQSQFKFYTQHISYHTVYRLHGKLSFLHIFTYGKYIIFWRCKVSPYVQSSFYHLTHCIFVRFGYMMLIINILYCLTIAHDISVKSILLAQKFGQKIIAGRYRNTIPIIITAHYPLGMSTLNHFTKRIKKNFV